MWDALGDAESVKIVDRRHRCSTPRGEGRCALGKSGCEVRLDSLERVKNPVDDMAAALPKEKAKECLATLAVKCV